jgi:hypothetical protein
LTAAPSGLKSDQRLPVLSPEGAAVNSLGRESQAG